MVHNFIKSFWRKSTYSFCVMDINYLKKLFRLSDEVVHKKKKSSSFQTISATHKVSADRNTLN